MARRADQRAYHYIYKITRVDGSGKYYIGMHSTDDLDDGYFGSGTLLAKSIKKHGKENHSKQIIEFLPSREALKLREKELVNEELLGDKQCMNLMPGGEGGGNFKDAQHQARCTAAACEALEKRMLADPMHGKRRAAHLGKFAGWKDRDTPRFAGLKHTDATKQKMRKTKNVGEANSQFGTCWITDGMKPIKIQKDQTAEYLSRGYRLGRK